MGFMLTSKGILSTLLEMFSFLASLLFAYRFFNLFGMLLQTYLHIPKGISDAVGFFLAWMIIESILYMMIYFFSRKYLLHVHLNKWNQRLGFIAAVFQGCLIFLFIISLVFALPVKGAIKNDILKSNVGPFFVDISQTIQSKTKNVFGGAVTEALNFMTIKPESNERVEFDFKLDPSQLSNDPDSEKQMFELINKERTKRGLKALKFDPELQELARSYGREMFIGGFFSHVSQKDGSTPGDRAQRAGIDYEVLGENLAFAPDVYIAHQGLMNSEGHRANILGEDYGKVGVGVIDGGVYGKMFVQEFSN
jgi:uncharacterized protein YkwD